MSFKNLLLNLVFITFGLGYIHTVEIRDCGSYFSYGRITLDKCDMDNGISCPLYIGTTMDISFEMATGPFGTDEALVNDVAFYVPAGPKFNLTVIPSNPCDVIDCPLKEDYTTTLSAKIHVDKIYQPLGYAVLRWILGPVGFPLLCFQFPVTIENPAYYD